VARGFREQRHFKKSPNKPGAFSISSGWNPQRKFPDRSMTGLSFRLLAIRSKWEMPKFL
jgi:hypothetical protein